MRICMFTNTYLPHVGGVARSVEFFARDLRNLGQDVLVVAPTFPDIPEEEPGEEVLRVPAVQNFNGSDFSVRITLPFVISSRIKDFRPDIIHSHHPYLLGDAALRTARRQEHPLVFTHHTLYEKYTHYVPLDSEAMQRFVISLSTRYANLCDRVVAPSASLARLIRERGVTTPVREVPTGVDLEYFGKGKGGDFRKAQGMPARGPVIGHVGRLAPEKNLDYLARAVAEYLRDNPGVFLVVGRGPSEKTIRRIYQDLELEERLFLAGEQTGQDLAHAYHAMDVFVFASKTETQGMVLVEAMAAGKPVIALDASGAREVVRDGMNGRLLEEDAGEEVFAKSLGEFFGNHSRAEQWKEKALETARHFSRESCAKKLLRLYEELLKEYSRDSAAHHEYLPWEKLLLALKAEWDLIAEKAGASAEAFSNEDPTRREPVDNPDTMD